MTRFLLVGLVLFTGVCCAGAQTPLGIGDRAPAFTLPYATQDTIVHAGISLETLLSDGPVVLAFYPADWSGGCTREMCTFRDNFTDLSRLNVQVAGVSGDYVHSHRAWAQHHKLPFPLLSDHDHAVAQAYRSYNERTGYNRRTVYLINGAGRIAYKDTSYSVSNKESYDNLLQAVEGIGRDAR